MTRSLTRTLLLGLSAFALIACSDAPESMAKVPEAEVHQSKPTKPVKTESSVKITRLTDNFHVLFGPGGNVGVSTGPDGVYLIDDKFADNAQDIIDAVATLSDQPIRYVLNTHLHGDHTGGNAILADTGAVVMAHDNVRKRMGMSYMNKAFGQMNKVKDESLWPVLTFSDTATLHFNGQAVAAIHTPSAHTDGDSIVHFMPANIIHMGDNFFNGLFPFVDVDSGGNLGGMIESHNRAIALSDANTVIIPGHGPITDKTGLTATRDKLVIIADRIKTRMDKGESLEQIIAAKPLADMSEMDSFIKQDGIITMAWRSMGGEF